MNIELEYGHQLLSLSVPVQTQVKGMQTADPLPDPAHAIRQALDQPIATASLHTIATQKLAQNPAAQAVIVVSDHTRPVPYRDEEGLISPLLHCLLNAGFPPSNILILIGAGSHRNMEAHEIEHMLGLQAAGLEAIQVINHEYEQEADLSDLGETQNGSTVTINRFYMEADLKIVTGLVESHFMAGASGGRKGICPGIVGKETLNIFHGGSFLNSRQAADLILEGNPLHEEASEIAQMAGCDFLLNVSLNAELQLTGVFAGDLFAAHQAAVRHIQAYVSIPLKQYYDIVMIHAGYVGVNHYQAAKAAIEAARAVKQNGIIILLAKHDEEEVLGGPGYRKSLKLLQQHGHERFMEMILDPEWSFIQEQWQVQMWSKVLQRIGRHEHLLYCCKDIPRAHYRFLPGTCMMDGQEDLDIVGEKLIMEQMMSRALRKAISLSTASQPSILVLQDGPYGIPEVQTIST